MSDDAKILILQSFTRYAIQEKGVISLKNFHAFSPEFIPSYSQEETDLKGFWNMKFQKFIKENGIKNFSKDQPNWDMIAQQIAETTTTNLNTLGKRRSKPMTCSPSSSTPCTNSRSRTSTTSTEDTNKRRKKTHQYLSEIIVPSVVLDTDSAKWTINDVAITEMFLEFRNATISKAKGTILESYQEELSLNSIFLVDGLNCVHPDSRKNYGFDEQTWKSMVNECRSLYPLQELTKSITDVLAKFAKAARNDFDDCAQIVKSIDDKSNPIAGPVKDSLRNLAKLYGPLSSKRSDKLESTFSISTVYPVFLPFLEESETISRNGTDGQGSSQSESSSDSKKMHLYSDLSLSYDFGAMPQEGLLIVEIKTPTKVQNGSRPDLVKLGNEMKLAIDKMVTDKIDDKSITVVGVLVEGFRCTLFVMDLLYQATYRLIPLSVFFIPRDRHDFSVLPDALEALTTMRHMVELNAEHCYTFFRSKPRKAIRNQYTVQSYQV